MSKMILAVEHNVDHLLLVSDGMVENGHYHVRKHGDYYKNPANEIKAYHLMDVRCIRNYDCDDVLELVAGICEKGRSYQPEGEFRGHLTKRGWILQEDPYLTLGITDVAMINFYESRIASFKELAKQRFDESTRKG